MYWTDWGSPAKIETASMDGTSRRTIVFGGLQWPNALTLDLATQTLYWADAAMDRMEASSTSGANRRVITSSLIFHPFGITFHSDVLYWTDWGYKGIATSPVSPFEPRGIRTNLNFNPMGIWMMSPTTQPGGMY